MRQPTSIINRQKRYVEIGRIRVGEFDRHPKARENWRMTSPNKTALEQAAQRYGGQVVPWVAKPGQNANMIPKGHFELETAVSEIPILITGMPAIQSYEKYSKGGCQRRCDGAVCQIPKDGKFVDKPCACWKDGERTKFGLTNDACSVTTRVKLFLPDVEAIGVWMLTTHSYYASEEIPTILEHLPPLFEAMIAIEHRVATRDGETRRYAVPVIRINQALRTILTGELPMERPALPSEAFREPTEEGFGDYDGEEEPEAQETEDTGSPETSMTAEEVGEMHRQPALIEDWPVFGGDADEKLKSLEFTPGEAKELEDSGVTYDEVMTASADTKENMRVALE